MNSILEEMNKEHELIIQKLIKYKLFEKKDFIYYDENITNEKGFLTEKIFLQVVPKEIYFFLYSGTLVCVKSSKIANKNISKEERIQDLNSISFEELIECIPKELAVKYLYHIDFFQEHLKVLAL